jgi:hypothetical protein
MISDRIKAHRSAPDVYDPPTFDQMADRIEELEAKLAVAVEIANSAVNALDEIQNYEQPNDPWAENALTMGELDAFDFSVFDARTTLAELKGDKKS